MRIGLFADSHGSTKEVTCRTRRPCLSEEKISEAMCFFDGCDCVICLGDLVDDCGTAEENRLYLKRLSDKIRAYNIPFYCIVGNHDCQNFTKKDFYAISAFSKPSVVTLHGKTLIFLDSCFHSDGTEYSPEAVDWTDSFLPCGEINMLKATLADRRCKQAYIFVHQCLDSEVEPRHIIKNAAEVRQIISDSKKAKGVYQGHYHKGHENILDGIAYHTLPAMVEGEKNFFEIIEI